MKSESFIPHTTQLVCHPATRALAVQTLDVSVNWSQADRLALSYTLTGDCHRLRIPSLQPQARVDGLWQHTCFEVFIAPKSGTAYWEFNFSPSSEWVMYQFRSYRDRLRNEEVVPPPQVVSHRATDHFTLDVDVYLPPGLTTQPLRLGLSAVIEDELGTLSYWALKHPSEKPDFHNADAFTLEITPIEMRATGKDTR